MLRLRTTLLLTALLAPMLARGQSEPALWRFIYPNAKAVISIDWGRIRESQTGAMIREQWLSPGAMPAVPGIELADDIDRVLISSPGNPAADDDAAEGPLLIAIHGHFDPAKVRQVFARSGAKPQSYNSFQVYRPRGAQAKDVASVLFDSETILYGDAPSIFATLDRNQFGPPLSQPVPAPRSLMARAAEMDATYDVWAIMDATEIMSSDTIAAIFQGGELASEAQGFEAGVNLRMGLVADVTFRFSSDDTAKRMTAELTHLMNVAANKSTDAQARNIAKKVKFGLDGSAMKISLRLTQQEFEKTAQALAASQQRSAQVAGNRPAVMNSKPAVADRAPTPTKPAVIRIEGLDGGERDIPYSDPQN